MDIVTDGLVLYLHGACGKNNPATRVWKDLSGNGNHGELRNFGYTENSGWGDGGLKFDGVDDYVQLPDLNLNPDSFTIQVDNKIRAFNDDKVITENGDEWGRNLIRGGSGSKKSGFFSHFAQVKDGYGEHTLTSKKQYSIVDIRDGFILGVREYEVGSKVTMSYDIMFTQWDFPDGTNRAEWWIGQRYTYTSSQEPVAGEWREVTKHALPVVGENGCELNEWYRVEHTMIIPQQPHESIGETALIQLYNSNPNISASVTFRIKNVKLEKGNIATDWTPAPEDITETNIINHTTPFVENNTVHSLKLYNRALTDEEILQNYQAGHEWTPQIGKREATTTMKPITSELSRKGVGKREVTTTMKPITSELSCKGKGKRELISTMKPITTSLERKGKGKREVISTMKPITSELNRKGVGKREVTTTVKPITSSISKKLPPIHVDMDISERIPKLEVD